MCRYCNYDLPVHYLLNNAPILDDLIQAGENTSEIIDADTELNAFIPDEDSSNTTNTNNAIAIEPEAESEIDESIDDLTVIEVSTTEEITSTFQVPDTAFDTELKGQREYSATLVGSEESPDWISLDSETGKLTFQAEYEEIGTHEIIVQVSDRFGESASSIVSLDVVSQEGDNTLLVDEEDITAIAPDPTIDNPIPQEIVAF